MFIKIPELFVRSDLVIRPDSAKMVAQALFVHLSCTRRFRGAEKSYRLEHRSFQFDNRNCIDYHKQLQAVRRLAKSMSLIDRSCKEVDKKIMGLFEGMKSQRRKYFLKRWIYGGINLM